MGGLTGFTYHTEDGKEYFTTCYVDDTLLASHTSSGLDDLISYLQAGFDDDYWYSVVVYLPSNATDLQVAALKKLFPNTTQVNTTGLVDKPLYGPDSAVALAEIGRNGAINNSLIIGKGTEGTTFGGFFHSVYASGSDNNVVVQLISVSPSLFKGGRIVLTDYDILSTGNYAFSNIFYITNITLTFDKSGRITRGECFPIGPYGTRMTPEQYNYWNGREVPDPFLPPDPYAPGGTSTGGGGGGSFDGSSTPVAHPSLPNLEVADTGFLTLYSPSATQVKAMADYLWSDGFSVDDFKKIFADPMEAILSLHAVPVSPATGALKEVKLGNVATGVYMPSVSSQWVQVNCGALTLPEYWGAYLDYNPYTTLQLYLPYIGTISVSADDVVGKPLSLQYNFDVLSGACAATLMSNGTVLYNQQGSGVMQIPFTSLTYGNLLSALTQLAGTALAVGTTIGIGAATGGVGLAPAIGAFGAGVGGVASAEVNAQKQSIAHGGAISGTAGFMGIQVPYFILSRPSLCLPDRQNEFIGYPSYITVNLSDISGYTEVDSIHLEGVPATDSELAEITRLLQQGVIF